MLDPWDSGDDSGTVFRDVILLALAGFVFITVLLLPHINPKAKDGEGATDPPGNVIAEMRWDDKLRTDVDLWVQAPGDVPVGYSNKSGLIFNLLRDDLGSHADPTDVNFETSFSRGIPPGEYIGQRPSVPEPRKHLPYKCAGRGAGEDRQRGGSPAYRGDDSEA